MSNIAKIFNSTEQTSSFLEKTDSKDVEGEGLFLKLTEQLIMQDSKKSAKDNLEEKSKISTKDDLVDATQESIKESLVQSATDTKDNLSFANIEIDIEPKEYENVLKNLSFKGKEKLKEILEESKNLNSEKKLSDILQLAKEKNIEVKKVVVEELEEESQEIQRDIKKQESSKKSQTEHQSIKNNQKTISKEVDEKTAIQTNKEIQISKSAADNLVKEEIKKSINTQTNNITTQYANNIQISTQESVDVKTALKTTNIKTTETITESKSKSDDTEDSEDSQKTTKDSKNSGILEKLISRELDKTSESKSDTKSLKAEKKESIFDYLLKENSKDSTQNAQKEIKSSNKEFSLNVFLQNIESRKDTEFLSSKKKLIQELEKGATKEAETKIKTEITESVKNETVNQNEIFRQDSIKTNSELLEKISKAKDTLRNFTNELKEEIKNYKPPISKISLELNPEKLGSVEVTITTKGQNLSININSNQSALNFLAQNSNEFKQSLGEAGFSDVSMSFGEGDSRQNSGQNPEDRENGNKNSLQTDRENIDIENIEIEIPMYT